MGSPLSIVELEWGLKAKPSLWQLSQGCCVCGWVLGAGLPWLAELTCGDEYVPMSCKGWRCSWVKLSVGLLLCPNQALSQMRSKRIVVSCFQLLPSLGMRRLSIIKANTHLNMSNPLLSQDWLRLTAWAGAFELRAHLHSKLGCSEKLIDGGSDGEVSQGGWGWVLLLLGCQCGVSFWNVGCC